MDFGVFIPRRVAAIRIHTDKDSIGIGIYGIPMLQGLSC
jgi:hypothetical protein